MITIFKLVPGKKEYSFVNRTVTLRNQLPAEALEIFPCKLRIARKSVRKVVTSKVK
jgi:hypothetical protein